MNNPFKLLGLSRDATKPEIMSRAAEHLKKNPKQIQEIAQAQKGLFDPNFRSIAEFVCFLDLPPGVKPNE